jgi:long-subunit fatty acid transport protein
MRMVDWGLRPRYCEHLNAVHKSKIFMTAALLACATPALAGPLDDPHVGSLGFSSPTTGDLTAVYWNPAALGMLQGNQFMFGASLRATRVTVDRAPIDPMTGLPGGTTSSPSATGSGLEQPMAWPPGPGGFIGVGAGVARRFALALAAYTPFSQKLSFDVATPTRYHLVSVDSRQLALVTGLAIELTDSLQVGIAPGLLFSYGHLVFDQDTALGNPSQSCPTGPCGVESPAAAARYDLATDGTQAPSYFVVGGIHFRRAAWEVGLAYSSAPLGGDGTVKLAMERSQVTPPATAATSDLCSTVGHSPCVSSEMRYHLPDIFTAGVTWHATSHLNAVGIVRWVRYGEYDRITIRLVGPSGTGLLGNGLPDQLVLYRGFQDSWDLRARLVHAPMRWFRWSGTLRMETSAVPEANVNAAAVDGLKLEPALATEFTLGRHLRIAAGYALTWMIPVTVGNSVFNPAAAAACAQAAYDLSSPACQTRLAGQALPTAAGSYKMLQHTLALMTTVSF